MLVVETVVHLGQLQFLLELASGGVLVDDGELNTGDAGEVFPSLTTNGGGHAGVVRTTGGDPALNSGLQARLRLPDGAGARKLLEGALRLNDVDDVHEQAEAFANVGHGDHDGVLGGLGHLLAREVDQQVGDGKDRVVGLVTDVDVDGGAVLFADDAHECERGSDPVVALDAAIVVRVE